METAPPIHVFVPTRGRYRKRKTINELHLLTLSKKGFLNLTVLVPDCEKHEWEEDIPTHVVPDEWRIERIREHIVNHFTESPIHFVFDDDLIIYRKTGKTTKERITTEEEIEEFFRHMQGLMQSYGHGGVATNQNHQFKDIGVYQCERVICSHFYHRNLLEGLHHTDAPEFEDLHISLSLIERGITNGVSYHYVLGFNSNTSGGCSRYRTLESQNAHAIAFYDLHRDHVTLSKPKYSSVWKGDKISVRVGWKKALRDATRSKTGEK